MSDVLQAESRRSQGELPYAVELELRIEDRDVVAELMNYAEGQPREEYALEALKIGVLALRRASAAMDGEFIKRETDRLLDSLGERLESHARLAKERMETTLREHFHPESGHFSQRVKQLTALDGDFGALLRSIVDGDDSKLAKTLASHVGQTSPLMKLLSPDQSQGLLAALRTNVEAQLQQQRERLVKEFSLDNPEGALCRLVKELSTKHGDLSKDLQGKIDAVVKEFSLDEENSALSRLVRNVDRAQRTITSEFSLDNEQSALRRLKTELTTILGAHIESAAHFQEEVKIALGKLVAKREAEARGTQHGGTFEQAVFEFVDQYAQRRGDVAESCGTTTGLIKNCKVGDAIIQLGAEHAAAGACIVVEAKEDASYTLRRAQEEIEQARKNRGAQHGVFVFSHRSAPAIEPLCRHGADVFVTWNPEDPQTDAYFRAGLEICRALCFRSSQVADKQQIDFESIDRAILEIEKRAQGLEQVQKSTETIRKSTETILDRVRIDRDALEKQVGILRAATEAIKKSLGDAGDGTTD